MCSLQTTTKSLSLIMIVLALITRPPDGVLLAAAPLAARRLAAHRLVT